MMRNFRNIAVLFVALLLAQPLHAAETKETKRVLIVYSLDKYHPAHRLTEQGMDEVFQEGSPFEVKVYSEYLDVGRFQGAEPVRAMADLLRRKYANVKIDAIITVYLSALDFLLREKPLLFPRVPIVAAEVSRTYAEAIDRSPLRRRITATIMGDNASGIVAAALRFKPKTQRFALVGGSTQLDAYYEQFFRAALKSEARPFEVIDLTRLPMQEILSRVGALPRDTVVLYGSIIMDGSGQSFTPRDALTLLSRASNAPVFGLYDTYLGYGIVGGHLISFERQGKIAATMALQLMAGASPADIPVAGEDAYVDLYDWRELKRWKIPETAIPEGSELRYYVPSFWEEYHLPIVGTLGLVFIETVLILGLLMNFRQRKHAERFLRASEERVQLTTDTAGAGLWNLDREGRLVWASERVFERYGLSKGEPATLERMLQAVHPEDRDLVRSAIWRAWETGNDVNAEYRLTLPGGEPRWIAARCIVSGPRPNADPLLIGASIDITERRRAENEAGQLRQELAHLNRVMTMTELSTSLAHEINQPLGAILNYANAANGFLSRNEPDLGRAREALQGIIRDDRRAADTILRIGGLLKKQALQYQPLRMNAVIEEVLAFFRGETSPGVSIETVLAPDLPFVRGDKIQLQQVLLNLLLNASDAMKGMSPDLRRILVRTEGDAAKGVTVSVRDHGPGIEESVRHKLFMPFTTTKQDGMGIGLAICARIVHDHGGSIRAEDNADGGATFLFTLPAVAESEGQQGA